jgi:hypothetical protein
VAKARRARRGIALPWERRGAWIGQLFTRRRFGVVVGVALAVAAVLGLWRTADERARIRATRAAIAVVRRGAAEFREDLGRCPRSTVELVHPPRTGVRYLAELPVDGWGRPLYVRCPGAADPEAIDVVSAGPSGDFFNDDNVE